MFILLGILSSRILYLGAAIDLQLKSRGSEDHLLPPSDDEFVYESIVKRSSIQLPKYRGY